MKEDHDIHKTVAYRQECIALGALFINLLYFFAYQFDYENYELIPSLRVSGK